MVREFGKFWNALEIDDRLWGKQPVTHLHEQIGTSGEWARTASLGFDQSDRLFD
jgi:hypothetical protein